MIKENTFTAKASHSMALAQHVLLNLILGTPPKHSHVLALLQCCYRWLWEFMWNSKLQILRSIWGIQSKTSEETFLHPQCWCQAQKCAQTSVKHCHDHKGLQRSSEERYKTNADTHKFKALAENIVHRSFLCYLIFEKTVRGFLTCFHMKNLRKSVLHLFYWQYWQQCRELSHFICRGGSGRHQLQRCLLWPSVPTAQGPYRSFLLAYSTTSFSEAAFSQEAEKSAGHSCW